MLEPDSPFDKIDVYQVDRDRTNQNPEREVNRRRGYRQTAQISGRERHQKQQRAD
ncbi:MAG: hypothetical protein M3367_11020 [Acidobacteriota bacterium]|nr:hypothetical protein [Acidobacteriota bacterium]